MVSSKGAVRKGNFVYVTHRQGEGVFNCDDGRSGPFTFASTGTAGTGYGTLGNERFTFTFGVKPSRKRFFRRGHESPRAQGDCGHQGDDRQGAETTREGVASGRLGCASFDRTT